jgi:hypothetical protein
MLLHHLHIGLQVPSLAPTTFCQPVTLGGPGGHGMEIAAWPILVPAAKDGFQICYTSDKNFRDTYVERGFCGLDASFRDQFNHKCPEQLIHVAPTVREGQEDTAFDDRQEQFIIDSGWDSFKNMLCHVRGFFERLNDRLVTVWAALSYFTFVTVPTATVGFFALLLPPALYLRILELLGFIPPPPDEDTAAVDARPAPPSDDDLYELVQHELDAGVYDFGGETTAEVMRRERRRRRGREILPRHAYGDDRDSEQTTDGYVDAGRATPSSSSSSSLASLGSTHATKG